MDDITHSLPSVIADYIAAHNHPDPDVFVKTFIADALLNVDVEIIRVEGTHIPPLAPFAVRNAETAVERRAL